jgi:hypothetical protein
MSDTHDTTGTVSYDGFVFGESGSTPPTYSVVADPQYDDADRTTSHVRYTLDVTTIVYADSEGGVAQQMHQLRERLSRPGRTLRIEDLGFGDTAVERGGRHADIAWGAKPRLLRFEPIGGTQAWQLHWQCEFNVTEGATPRAGCFLALNVRQSFEIDDAGLTTREIAGHAQVAGVRKPNGDASVVSIADQVRDRIKVRVPDGFRRARQRWDESTDKTRLDFSIIDRQLPGDPLPTGISDGQIDFEVEADAKRAGLVAARLSGYLESAPGSPKSLAAAHLLSIAQDRLSRLQAAQQPRRIVFPSRFAIRHQLFSRRTHVDVRYQLIGGIRDVLSAGGIWDPVPGSDYRLWAASLEHIWGSRGAAGLKADPRDAAIIDLVDNPTEQIAIHAPASPPTASHAPSPLTWLTPVVTPEQSWLEYRVRVRVRRTENVHVHTLSTFLESRSETGEPTGVGTSFASTGGRRREVHGEPTQTVRLEGVARRLQYPPTMPTLRSVGSRSVTPRDRVEERETVGDASGVPIHQLRWSALYDIDGFIRPHEAPGVDSHTKTASLDL